MFSQPGSWGDDHAEDDFSTPAGLSTATSVMKGSMGGPPSGAGGSVPRARKMSADSPPFVPASPILTNADPSDLKTLDEIVPIDPPYTLVLNASGISPTEEQVRMFFDAVGGISRVHIAHARGTSKPNGMIYVDLSTRDQLIAALLLDGSSLLGKAVAINVAPPRPPKRQGDHRKGGSDAHTGEHSFGRGGDASAGRDGRGGRGRGGGGRGGGASGDRGSMRRGPAPFASSTHRTEEPASSIPAERPRLLLKKRTTEAPVGGMSDEAAKSGLFGDARPVAVSEVETAKTRGPRAKDHKSPTSAAGRGRGKDHPSSKPAADGAPEDKPVRRHGDRHEGHGDKHEGHREKHEGHRAKKGAPSGSAEGSAPASTDEFDQGRGRRGRGGRGARDSAEEFSSTAASSSGKPENKFAGFADSDDE